MSGFPTLFLFPGKAKGSPIQYQGEREIDELAAFVMEKVRNATPRALGDGLVFVAVPYCADSAALLAEHYVLQIVPYILKSVTRACMQPLHPLGILVLCSLLVGVHSTVVFLFFHFSFSRSIEIKTSVINYVQL